MKNTATQALESQRNREREASMARLLDDLREFMRAAPRIWHEEMPDIDVFWVDHLDAHGRSPAKTIIDAINACPDLWADAIPEDVVIVPRRVLKNATLLDDDMIDALNDHGRDMVLRKADALRYAREEAERQERYSR